MTEQPVRARDTRQTDPGLRRLAAITVATSLLVWWPAFTLGVYDEIFFEQLFALWAAATAAFVVAVVLLQTKGSTMAEPPTEAPVLDLLASMTADSLAASSLDTQTLMLVRIAALAAVDAPSVSYLMNLGAAADAGLDAEQVRGVLAGIAPIVGTARVASATGKIVDALAVAIEVAELEERGEQ